MDEYQHLISPPPAQKRRHCRIVTEVNSWLNKCLLDIDGMSTTSVVVYVKASDVIRLCHTVTVPSPLALTSFIRSSPFMRLLDGWLTLLLFLFVCLFANVFGRANKYSLLEWDVHASKNTTESTHHRQLTLATPPTNNNTTTILAQWKFGSVFDEPGRRLFLHP